MKEIRVFGDPVLRERAAEVDTFNRRIRKLAQRMVSIMQEAGGLGLAAPQIGERERVLVYDAGKGPHILVNPILDDFSEETEEGEEGCLSVPGLTILIERSLSVRVHAKDAYGAPIGFVAKGLKARVVQHEVDHLNGVLIVDHGKKEDSERNPG